MKDSTIENNSQTVEILQPYSSGPVVRALTSGDFVATRTHPLGGTLSGSLSSIDFLRVSVNPTWWAYDGLGANPKAAREMQHGDPERFFRYCGFGSSFAWNTQNSNINMGTTKWNEGGELASNPAILLLDELSMGLAPLVVEELYTIVAEIAAGGVSILVIEQFARTVLGIADLAAIMVHGQIRTVGAPADVEDELSAAYLGGDT